MKWFNFGRFLIIFGLVLCGFCVTSCSSQNLMWSNNNLILTYNRHSGQLEVMWESNAKHYQHNPDSTANKSDNVNNVVKQ